MVSINANKSFKKKMLEQIDRHDTLMSMLEMLKNIPTCIIRWKVMQVQK